MEDVKNLIEPLNMQWKIHWIVVMPEVKIGKYEDIAIEPFQN